MKIALDYDDTFTADPELWKPFVAHCKARLHEVKFVTARGGTLLRPMSGGYECYKNIETCEAPKKLNEREF